jgi:rubrerythrin
MAARGTPRGVSEAAAVVEALRRAAEAEKAQALFYRALAAAAESPALAERLNGLLADEQHQHSRLVARLLELGDPAAVTPQAPPEAGLPEWESSARRREREEIERYLAILDLELDARTRSMIEEFLAVERRHEEQLGGKWMGAQGGKC